MKKTIDSRLKSLEARVARLEKHLTTLVDEFSHDVQNRDKRTLASITGNPEFLESLAPLLDAIAQPIRAAMEQAAKKAATKTPPQPASATTPPPPTPDSGDVATPPETHYPPQPAVIISARFECTRCGASFDQADWNETLCSQCRSRTAPP